MWPDETGTWGPDPYSTDAASIGPNTDGTYTAPAVSITPAPADAGGGAPASYSQQVMDILRYGVGAVVNYQNQGQLLDYRRWEATATGPVQQGRTAGVAVTRGAATGGASMLPVLLIGGALLFLALKR